MRPETAAFLRSLIPQIRKGRHSFEFRNHNLDIQDSTLPEIILSGPAGTGKSLAWLYKMHQCALRYPGFRGAIIRKTRESLTQTGLVTFERDVLGLDHPLVVNGPRRENRSSYVFDNGSEIIIAGMDRPSRILSGEFDLMFFQQVEELYEADWETAGSRLRSGQMPYQQLAGDCNPEHPYHWIKQREEQDNVTLWETVHKDNPWMWDGEKWTEAGEQYLARLNRLTGSRRSRLLLGMWAVAEGVIYDELDTAIHVVHRDRSEFRRFVAGVDEGYTNPAVILVIGLDTDERMHIFAEYYRRGIVQDDFVNEAAKLHRGWGIESFHIDPSAAGLIAAMQIAGLPIGTTKHDVYDGIQAVKARFTIQGDGKSRLTIEPGLTNILSEFGSYVWKEGRTGMKDEPEKTNDHAMDALRYAVMSLGSTEPGELELGMIDMW